MKILVIGAGGREHAVAWKFSKSPKVSKVFVAPGNPGMRNVAETVDIDQNNIEALAKFAKENKIDLTFVGPEIPLSLGIVNKFQEHNLKIFGPTKEAAEIESSKSYCKYILEKYKIPTAKYIEAKNYDEAIKYINKQNSFPTVIKVDGLAAGKGVMIPSNLEDAKKYLDLIFKSNKFGDVNSVVIEEFLEGKEFSLLAFTHKNITIPLQIAQDYKRAFDGDKGENTGGMGSYTPVDFLSEKFKEDANEIVQNMADALVAEGRPFTGILFAGLMLTNKGVKVIEFNARFGDPETEVVLPALKTDIVDIVENILEGKKITPEWSNKKVVGVVLASKGYPDSYQKGLPIRLESLKDDELTFSMGIKMENGAYQSNGGRVAIVVDSNIDFAKARLGAYKKISKIKSEDFFYRKDIGLK